MNAVAKPVPTRQFSTEGDYKVADISLADWGRKEIDIAEHEMPGLMSIRRSTPPHKPLKGVRVTGSLHMTIQTAVLIETLKDLGADVRWASCNIFSTQDHAAAAIAATGMPVFAWKGETLEEYWDCTLDAVTFPGGKGPELVVDDGGDVTLLIHKGYELEKGSELGRRRRRHRTKSRSSRTCSSASPRSAPASGTNVVKDWRGVSEETTTGVHRLYQMPKQGKLLVPAINVNDSVTKSKFDNLYGCRESLADGIKRATDVMLAGKVAVRLRLRRRRQGLGAFAARPTARASSSPRSIRSTRCRRRWKASRSTRSRTRLGIGDIYVTTTGNKDVITLEHMQKMKDQAIVCNIGHFDNEIQVDALEHAPGVKQHQHQAAGRQVHLRRMATRIFLLAEGRLVNLGCATGHPSFVMSNRFSNQTLAQIDLWANKDTYEKTVYRLPKQLDEEVARLHLEKIGVKLTKLTDEQADYLGVPVEGPYKPDHYRY